MMFVFGEVADPLQDTTLLVEDIVRSQVIELVSKGESMSLSRLKDRGLIGGE